jgi:hypothetical protein
MQNSVAKKIFAVGSAVAMTLSLAVPFVAMAAVHADGTNVAKSDGTVGMMIGGTFRPYTSAGAFLSYGFNSWASVVPANSDDLAAPVGSFIPPQDGKVMCSDRGSDKGTCYLITGSEKAGFTSAAVFTGLGFSFSNAGYGDVSWMSTAPNIDNSTAAHLPGVLVNNNGTVQLVGANGLLGIPDLATFNSWGYSFTNVVPANAADQTMTQTGVMAARVAGQLSPTALANNGSTTCTSNCSAVVNGSVSAMLSSDTPAAGTLVSNGLNATAAGQVGADIAHFTFSGSGTVTQVVVNRIGVSADTSVNNVYLYQGNNRITDAGSFSNGKVTFSNASGLFTVSGSMEIGVRIDVGNGTISGQTLGAQLASYTVANGSPETTSISGNLFNIASVSNLATVQLSGTTNLNSGITSSAVNPTSSPCTSNCINAGTMNAVLWSVPINVGQRAVLLKYIQFKQIGSISQSAIQNLHLFVDGTSVGPVASITNSGSNTNVVIFDLTGSPITLNTGGHTLELHGDIITGTSYTFSFSLQQAADAVFYDTSYNVNVPLAYNTGGQIVQLSPGVATISSGTVSVQQDPTFTATQFVPNASQVTLGQWTMKSYGEDVKVQTLTVQLAYTGLVAQNEGFNNLSLYVNGGQVGSSLSALCTTPGGCTSQSPTYPFGSTNLFTIPAGTTVTVAVKGDSVRTNSTFTSVVASLLVPINALQGVTSFALSPSTQGSYSSNSLSTSATVATLAKNTAYANQTIGANTQKQEIGSFVIQAGNADGVRVTSLNVGVPNSQLNGFNNGNTTQGLANLYIVTPDYPNGTTPVNPSTGNTFTTNFTIPANQTATVSVYADVSNATGTITTTLYGQGIGSSSNQVVYLTTNGLSYSGSNAVGGQAIQVGNGTISNYILQTSSPVASFVIGGGTNQPAATFNFVASSGGATIQEMDFTVATSTGGTAIPVTGVTVGGINGSMVGATTTVTGLSIAVPATYGGVDVPVTMNLANVGLNGIKSNQQFVLKLVAIKYLSGSVTSWAYPNLNSNPFDLVGSAPTVTLTASGNTLTTGNITVGSITIAANAGGNIIATSVPISISANSASVVGTAVQFIDASNGTVAGTSGSVNDVNGASTTTVTLTTDNNIAASSSKTYNIVVPVSSVGGTGINNYSVTVGLTSPPVGFTFQDVNGGVGGIPAAVASVTLGGVTYTGATAPTYIVNYPTNTVTSHQ